MWEITEQDILYRLHSPCRYDVHIYQFIAVFNTILNKESDTICYRVLVEKLVSLVSKFGMKMNPDRPAVQKKSELYGPSHKHKTNACHSQDDVDDILNQFGF